MNKRTKKLTLAKETLMSMEEDKLKKVDGGSIIFCWSGYNTCGTCGATCGTNLC